MDSVASRSPLYLELPDQLEYVFTLKFSGLPGDFPSNI